MPAERSIHVTLKFNFGTDLLTPARAEEARVSIREQAARVGEEFLRNLLASWFPDGNPDGARAPIEATAASGAD